MGPVWGLRRKYGVVIWDSNPFNPYGAEVARAIRLAGVEGVRFCRGDAVFDERDDIAVFPQALSTADRPHTCAGLVWHRFRYLCGIIQVVGSVLSKRPIVVMPWFNTKIEALCCLLLEVAGVSVIVVNHNPIPERGSGMNTKLDRLVRRRASRIVVHQEHLRLLSEKPESTHVVPHPAYFAWLARYSATSQGGMLELTTRSKKSALWFGAARSDKGFFDLPEIAAELQRSDGFLTVAPGIMSLNEKESLEDIPNLKLVNSSGYLADEVLYVLLRDCSVVVAPYRHVTASGSVMMALTLNRYVVCYREPSLLHLEPAVKMVSDDDPVALAQLSLLAPSWQPDIPREIAQSSDRAAVQGWLSVLASLDVAKLRP